MNYDASEQGNTFRDKRRNLIFLQVSYSQVLHNKMTRTEVARITGNEYLLVVSLNREREQTMKAIWVTFVSHKLLSI